MHAKHPMTIVDAIGIALTIAALALVGFAVARTPMSALANLKTRKNPTLGLAMSGSSWLKIVYMVLSLIAFIFVVYWTAH